MKMKYNRRDFLKVGAGAVTGLALGSINVSGRTNPLKSVTAQIQTAPIDPVRVGFVGVGGQGSSHVRNYLNIEGVEVRAICDIVESKVARMQERVVETGQPKPAGYSRGETDFKRMCAQEDLDLVFTATSWEWHVPVCVEAMKTGKHAAVEVPAAVTLDECWELVETAEKTGKYCIMMENCCYMDFEMMVLNMVRKGLLGELLHGEAGYMHDLRSLKFRDRGEGLWRGAHSAKRNGNLYPTHGLGPIAESMNINRGDRFDYLVSTSSKARGLNLYAKENLSPDNPKSKLNYINGDVNSCLIQTVNGLTIIVQHSCDAPRPYSRFNILQGTNGITQGYPEPLVYIEGKSSRHRWEPAEMYMEEFQHPLLKTIGEKARNAGHGGADYIEDYRFVQALRNGTQPDMDVYDAAAWSVVTELSERSVANRSRTMDFPDFTKGKWKINKPIFVVDM